MDNNNTGSKKAKRRYGGGSAATTSASNHVSKRHPANVPRNHSNGRVRKTRSGNQRKLHPSRDNSENGDPYLRDQDCAGGQHVEYERTAPWEDADRYILWPGWVTLLVYVVTLVTRVWVVSDKVNWWILHPDEVFQSIEVAHSEVYGYGFRPYEFLPPHTPGSEPTTLAGKQEAEMGMYSLRSWLYPRFYMLIFHIKEYFGNEQSPFLIAKLFHTVVAAHLPLSVYFFTAHVTLSVDIATSAAILVAFSEHLAVLGTHTFVNSFLSPFVFIALAFLYPLLIKDAIVGGAGPSELSDLSSSDSESRTPSCSGTPTKDVNGNAKSKMAGIEEETNENDQPLLSEGIASAQDSLNNEGSSTQTIGTKRLFTCGLLLALLCYIRVDLLLLLAITGLFLFTDVILHPIDHLNSMALLLLGGLTGLLIGGLDDLYSYGVFLMSPYQWFRFNVLTDLPNVIFGLDSSWTYIELILNYDTLTRVQSVIIAGTFTYSVYHLLFVQDTDRNRQLNKCQVRLVLATVTLITIYSLKGHKEVRFLHHVIVLFHITCALSFTILYRKVIDSVQAWFHSIRLHARMLFVLYGVSLAMHLPSPKDQSNRVWAYKGVWDSNHINECLHFISQQPDVTGLFSDRNIHENAAYSVLHQDIPIFSLFHQEFIEFDKTARKTLPPNNYFSSGHSVKVTVTSQISNFIATENSPLLLKTLVNEPNYNYLILKTSRKLVNTGFVEVFRSGTMRVMKRTTKPAEVEELQKVADSIPIGRNATVLEYEGSWLMTYGLRHVAMERFEAAVAIDSSRVRAFQLLALIYRDAGRKEEAKIITNKCYRYNGRNRCLQPQPKVSLQFDTRGH